TRSGRDDSVLISSRAGDWENPSLLTKLVRMLIAAKAMTGARRFAMKTFVTKSMSSPFVHSHQYVFITTRRFGSIAALLFGPHSFAALPPDVRKVCNLPHIGRQSREKAEPHEHKLKTLNQSRLALAYREEATLGLASASRLRTVVYHPIIISSHV